MIVCIRLGSGRVVRLRRCSKVDPAAASSVCVKGLVLSYLAHQERAVIPKPTFLGLEMRLPLSCVSES